MAYDATKEGVERDVLMIFSTSPKSKPQKCRLKFIILSDTQMSAIDLTINPKRAG